MACRNVRLVHTWSFIFVGAFLTVVLVHLPQAAANTDNWTFGSGTGNWSTASNWTYSISFHAVPAAGDTVNIIDSDAANETVNYDYTGPAVTLDSLFVDNRSTGSAVNTLAISGNALSVGNFEEIGDIGRGAVVQSGGNASGGDLFIGYQAGSSGVYSLSGGTLGMYFQVVGYSGTGTFNQSGGSNSMAELDLGLTAGAKGTYTIDSGSLSTTGFGIDLGGNSGSPVGGTGVLNVSGAATVFANVLEINNTPGSAVNFSGGSINLNSLNVNGNPSLFHWTGGTLTMPASVTLDPGASPTSTSAAFGNSLSLGMEQTLVIGGDETLGGNSPFGLTIGAGADNAVSGNLTVNSASQLYLSGGTLSVNNLLVNGTFNWTAGTLNINNNQGITFGTGGPLGSVYTLGSGQNLNVFAYTTVSAGSALTIAGGNLNGYSLINNGNFALNSGGFTVYTLFNNAGGLFVVGQNAVANIQGPVSNAGEIQLGGGAATLYNSQGYSINNTGLIHGDGVISMNVSNSTGEIRAENGKRLKITGGLGTNFGKINLQGGTLELTQPFTNGAGSGQIEGRGTLIVGGSGLTNNGNIAFSGGTSDVFGDVHNSTGTASQGITISGNSNVTFWDDVTNGASDSDPTLFRVSSGSVATFFGAFSGNGVSGTGSVFYEADVSPGFSPASVNYGGSVTLDSTSDLKIELGGRTVGTQYDKLNVAGQLSLDGKLDVLLINGFKPKAGDTFDILNWGSLSGAFAGGVNLPTLGGRIVWNTSALYSTGVLSVTAAYYAGDFNLDGHVDAADIIAAEKALTNLTGYESQYGVTAGNLNLVADVNGDGNFTNADLQDLLIIIKNGGGSADPVPEPTSLALLSSAFLLGTVVYMRSRPRRNCG